MSIVNVFSYSWRINIDIVAKRILHISHVCINCTAICNIFMRPQISNTRHKIATNYNNILIPTSAHAFFLIICHFMIPLNLTAKGLLVHM